MSRIPFTFIRDLSVINIPNIILQTNSGDIFNYNFTANTVTTQFVPGYDAIANIAINDTNFYTGVQDFIGLCKVLYFLKFCQVLYSFCTVL